MNQDDLRIEATNDQIQDNGPENDYISAINEIKANSVEKTKYEKVVDDNKKLLKALVDGGQVSTEATQPEAPIADLRKDLFNKDHTNLAYVETALQLRDRLLSEGQPDPFLPYGEKIMPTEEDIATANRVAEVFQACVDYADGDSTVFTNELQRRTVDTGIKKPLNRR